MNKLRFYKIKDKYIEYCRLHDSKVPDAKIDIRQFHRKFVGIVLEVGTSKYFAPLSSFKPKHKNISDRVDIIKIEDKNGEYAVINLNNMVPVPDCAIIYFDFNDEQDTKYKSLLYKQYAICQKKKDKILKNAKKLYEIVTINKTQYYINLCCDFKLLEQKMQEYVDMTETVQEQIAATKD